jgi:glycosyltransferase involved in cell wall biosynthesis
MKKILYFMPDNPLAKDEGNKIRALNILEYFRRRNMYVHFVSEYIWGGWSEEDIVKFMENKIADELTVIKRKPLKNNNILYYISYKVQEFFYLRSWRYLFNSLKNLVTKPLQKAFNEILKKNNFDYIIISYVSWSHLIINNKFIGNAKLIIDTHDFLTAQLSSKKNFKLGATFEEEIRRLNEFDEVWAISTDEQYVFSQFSKSNIKHIPFMMDAPNVEKNTFYKEYSFDIIYIASENPHNKSATKWFFNNVYPKLSKDINICIIGKINKHIGYYNNVTSIPFTDDLQYYYLNSKIAMCPMLTGTGLKIKTVEALSYGKPVVCSTRGIDGLPNKSNNGCLISDDSIEFANHISNLLASKTLFNELSLQALEAFNNNFSKDIVYAKLDKSFDL